MKTALAGAATLTATSFVLVGYTDSTSPEPAEQQRPNVVVIMTDDMRVDDLAAMPQTRQLLGGDNGARYTSAYASTPLCCPSRATFLTGQYSHNNGVHDNLGADGGMDALDDSSTLPVWLQRGGYQTVMIGKYLNGYGTPEDGVEDTYIPPGWDHWAGLPDDTVNNYTDFDVTVGSSTPDAAGVGETKHVANGYQTWNLTSRAVNRIGSSVPAEQPMFMWLNFFAPHDGGGDFPHRFVPAEPQYRGDSRVGLPASPAVDEFRVNDKPPWIRDLPRLTAGQESDIVTQRRERRDSLKSVDDSVGRVVDALRASGELDNTVIVFTSDNGWMLGEHRIGAGKVFPYLEAAEAPLLIRGPGFTPGVHSEPVSNVDLAPTIAALAGATPGLPVDGMPLTDPIPADRPILIEFLGDHPADLGMPPYSGVIQNGEVYIEYTTGARELYDMTEDPSQQRNLAGDASQRAVRQDLAATLDHLRA